MKNQLIAQRTKAKELLYIGDNCGEIVMDKRLIRLIKEVHPELKVTFGVAVMSKLC